MTRVVVMGVRGSGKSTLARQVGVILGIEVVHLDELFWRPGWNPTPWPEWESVQQRLVARPAWILDGQEGLNSMETRLEASDTVILLDLPARVCSWRLLKRSITRRRHQVAPGCPEKFDWKLYPWVWLYRKRRLPAVMEKLSRYDRNRQIIVLRSRAGVQRFLLRLRAWRLESAGF